MKPRALPSVLSLDCRVFRLLLATLVLALLVAGVAGAELPADVRQKIDDAAREILRGSGVPGATIAVVRDDELVYSRGYGDATLELPVAAKPSMRFGIGSISKQFTAAAVLLLAEEGKLSLDDRLSRFLPDLTRANEITLRHLLSHTSGYQDYWPQDYVMPSMLRDTTAQQIIEAWARKPLDFDPGEQWQYSNTGYVIAGLVVEQVAGVPLFTFLQQRIFAPLGMRSVMNLDQEKLSEGDARGYIRYALGPARPAVKEGKGWLFAAGGLAMTAEDLAKWDIALLQRRVLKPVSHRELATDVRLNDGLGTRYGLGVSLAREAGRRVIQHGGEVSGFCTHNLVLPDHRAAVIVLTNRDAHDSASALAKKIVDWIVPAVETAPEIVARDRAIFVALQRGEIDRAQFTANCNAYFTAEALRDFSESLAPLGEPVDFVATQQGKRGGLTTHFYSAKFKDRTVSVWVRAQPDGTIEQYQVTATQ